MRHYLIPNQEIKKLIDAVMYGFSELNIYTHTDEMLRVLNLPNTPANTYMLERCLFNRTCTVFLNSIFNYVVQYDYTSLVSDLGRDLFPHKVYVGSDNKTAIRDHLGVGPVAFGQDVPDYEVDSRIHDLVCDVYKSGSVVLTEALHDVYDYLCRVFRGLPVRTFKFEMFKNRSAVLITN